MSKVTTFVFICVLFVIKVQNSHGQSKGKLTLQRKVMVTAFTPFDSNEKLDLSLVPQIAEYYKTKNISVVYITAYYGGGGSLPINERKELVLAWVEQSNNLGFDLIVEIGAAPFVEVLEYARFCSENNVTALTAFAEMVYQPAVPSEIVMDMQKICDAANDIPVMYHEFVVVEQEVDAVQTYLSACSQVSCFAGIIASADKLTILRASAPNDLDCQFWVEHTDQTAPGLILQMNAVTSPAVNLCPGTSLDIEKAVDSNDIDKALQLQQKINTVVADVCNFDGGVLDYTSRTYFENMKTAFFYISGMDTGVRYPLETPNSTVTERLRTIAANLDCY